MTLHPARLVLPALAVLTAALALSCGGGSSPDANFTITLRYCSDAGFSSCSAANQAGTDEISDSQRALIRHAADRLERLITAGLVPGRTLNDKGNPLTCYRDEAQQSGVVMNETVHGLLVLVVAEDLGTGGTLASSGPCMVRYSSKLPLVAVMKLNKNGTINKDTLEADGRLETVVFHELFHTLGFGTIWTGKDAPVQLVGTGVDSSDPRFLGAQALAKAIAVNDAPATWTSVPLEGGGLEGTSSSHWRQSTFANDSANYELMTGFVAPAGTPEQLSATTLGSLADLGYAVDYSKAEPFIIPHPSALRALVSAGATPVGDDVLRIPVSTAE